MATYAIRRRNLDRWRLVVWRVSFGVSPIAGLVGEGKVLLPPRRQAGRLAGLAGSKHVLEASHNPS